MKNLLLRTGCGLGWFGLAAAGRAGEAGGSVAPAVTPPDLGASLLRVTGALALVLGIFLGGVWVFRNWQRVAVRRGLGRKLDIKEVRPLGGRQAIYVVGYEQERFLLASSPAGVSFLAHLPPATGKETAPENEPGNSFSRQLARGLKDR